MSWKARPPLTLIRAFRRPAPVRPGATLAFEEIGHFVAE